MNTETTSASPVVIPEIPTVKLVGKQIKSTVGITRKNKEESKKTRKIAAKSRKINRRK